MTNITINANHSSIIGPLLRDGMDVSQNEAYKVLFDQVEVKFPHPITCLNKKEWNKIKFIRTDEDGSIWVRSEESCWFHFASCEVRPAINHQNSVNSDNSSVTINSNSFPRKLNAEEV